MIKRLHIIVQGTVQGVGFRPFIYRLAQELNLTGWVNNSNVGVFIEAEGNSEVLDIFLGRLTAEKPEQSHIDNLESEYIEPVNDQEFVIRSSVGGEKTALILPDLSTCNDCLQEIFTQSDRRYHYPFTNCTNCGPRYSIMNSLPYDRPHTTMGKFIMCEECQAEYKNPLDRRFHAQPNACSVCGPQLFLWDEQGQAIAENFLALELASEAIKQGQIIALKGLGGFQLLVKASDQAGVNLLRQRKRRSEKPFAVMFPNIELVKKCCLVSTSEENLLLSPASPIVLLKLLLPNNSDQLIAQNINPGNPYLGVMLPYTPLHHLLMQELNFPVVATSGNISDEPICIDELEAFTKLKGIADLFLVHNRAIARPVDDSIVRIIADQPMILRRARGYAPLPIKINQIHQVSNNLPHILAVGGHLKNTIAISKNQQVLISQHIGDLSNSAAFQVFQDVINNLENLYDFVPDIVACDAHPDYISSKFTDQLNLPVVRVQHHYAHILACMAENNINPPVLGVAWDGTGYGLDQTIWGGEFIYITEKSWQRVAHFRPFPLLGGESSIKQPAKIALGLLYTIFGAEIFQENFAKKALLPINNFSVSELKIFAQMLEKNLNTPQTSSVGRLFDAIAGLTNLYSQVSFEGQAAMGLEFAINHHNYHDDAENGYPLSIENIDQLELNNPHSLPLIIDWQPMILAILGDLPQIPISIISQKFHHTLINSIINIAQIINQKIPTEKIVLSGGCFQNKYLLENSLKKLQDNHFIPYWHKKIPPNDGGIALGQIMAVLRAISPE